MGLVKPASIAHALLALFRTCPQRGVRRQGEALRVSAKADRSRRYINQLDEWFRPLVIWRECAAPCMAAKLVVGRGMPGHLVTARAETSQIFGRINSCDGLMPVAPVTLLNERLTHFSRELILAFGVRRGCQRRREAIVKPSREWRT